MNDSSTSSPVVGVSSVSSVCPSFQNSPLVQLFPRPDGSLSFNDLAVRVPRPDGPLWVDSASGELGLHPVSNTGGKLGMGLVWQDECIGIDTFTFTFSGAAFGFDVLPVRKWINRFTDGLISVGGRVQSRYNGYPECYQLLLCSGLGESQFLGWLGVSFPSDNMRGRWCLHLTGAACEFLKPWHWNRLYAECVPYDIKITRCDVCYDDYEGLHPVSEVKGLFESGGFITSGRSPKGKYIEGYGDGDTFYVGKRGSGKMLRSYDKGKQLGDSSSTWVRHELELHSKDRTIPYDILLNPGAFLQGAYPAALSWLGYVAETISTYKNKSKVVFSLALQYAKRQVGRLVRYCKDVAGYDCEKVVQELIADEGRYPLRLIPSTV